MRYLVVIALLLAGCSKTIPVSNNRVMVNIVVQESCVLDNEEVYGWTKVFNEDFAKVCISKNSPDMEKTLRHEMEHVGRAAVGLPISPVGH